MRSAPPVRWVCSPQPAWRAAQSGLVAVAAAVVAAWASAWAELGEAAMFAAVLTTATLAALLGWALLRQPRGELEWSGQRWSFLTAEGLRIEGRLDAAVDLGSWMLLRFRPPAASRWIAVSRGARAAAWSAFRAALYSSATQPPSLFASAESQPD
jgi:hypothetical protein